MTPEEYIIKLENICVQQADEVKKLNYKWNEIKKYLQETVNRDDYDCYDGYDYQDILDKMEKLEKESDNIEPRR